MSWINDSPVYYTTEVGEHKNVDVKRAWVIPMLQGLRESLYFKCQDCLTSHFAFAGSAMMHSLERVSCPPPKDEDNY